LKKYLEIARSLNIDVLVESHTREEVERALKLDVKIFGINNRNLKTFSVDLNTTLELGKLIPNDRVLVSESGIVDESDIKKLKEANIDAILVGETFMRSDDMNGLAKKLKKSYI
ncbi:MAG: indole-3-glycerol phosphate synthase, partial [Psychrilyobacter sp.]|nr:indole-3-glycerol phosphate synthase [Psychrilyobacter sp.]